jgi:hypothetical protein
MRHIRGAVKCCCSLSVCANAEQQCHCTATLSCATSPALDSGQQQRRPHDVRVSRRRRMPVHRCKTSQRRCRLTGHRAPWRTARTPSCKWCALPRLQTRRRRQTWSQARSGAAERGCYVVVCMLACERHHPFTTPGITRPPSQPPSCHPAGGDTRADAQDTSVPFVQLGTARACGWPHWPVACVCVCLCACQLSSCAAGACAFCKARAEEAVHACLSRRVCSVCVGCACMCSLGLGQHAIRL